jgi:hypothetical protein
METTHINSHETATIKRTKIDDQYGYWISGGRDNATVFLGKTRKEAIEQWNWRYAPYWTNPWE